MKSLDAKGVVRTELALDDQPSGLGWLPDGRLLIVAMCGLKVLRRDGGRVRVHADLAASARHRANDMVVDAHGRAYVGNFGFDIDAELRKRGPKSVYSSHPTTSLARVDPDGRVHVAAAEMHCPNGMAITPEGRTLIVAKTLTAFSIGAGGELSARRVWAPLRTRAPDGIGLDADGNVRVANALAQECVLVAAGGEVLEVVQTDQRCSACMLGERDHTLYMLTAPSSNAAVVSTARRGHALAAEVRAGRAGWP